MLVCPVSFVLKLKDGHIATFCLLLYTSSATCSTHTDNAYLGVSKSEGYLIWTQYNRIPYIRTPDSRTRPNVGNPFFGTSFFRPETSGVWSIKTGPTFRLFEAPVLSTALLNHPLELPRHSADKHASRPWHLSDLHKCALRLRKFALNKCHGTRKDKHNSEPTSQDRGSRVCFSAGVLARLTSSPCLLLCLSPGVSACMPICTSAHLLIHLQILAAILL